MTTRLRLAEMGGPGGIPSARVDPVSLATPEPLPTRLVDLSIEGLGSQRQQFVDAP